MLKMKFLYKLVPLVSIIWNLITLMAAEKTKVDFGACVTPNSTYGLCLRLQDCEYIYNLLLEGHQSEGKEFLQKSQCGLDNTAKEAVKKILVCCSIDYSINETHPYNSENIPSNFLPKAGQCGKVLTDHIVGGIEAQLNEFPWIALLKYMKPNNVTSFDCAGSLINNQYILTAAHCVKSKKVPSYWNITHIRLGEHNLNTAPDCTANGKFCAPLHRDVPIESIIAHEDYIPESKEQFNDIALIRMKERIHFTEFIRPICLPFGNELKSLKENTLMQIAGWGATETSNLSNVKLEAMIKFWSLKECLENYSLFGIDLKDSQICAGGEPNIDTCRGDSGGPLMFTQKVGKFDTVFIVGIVSYGPKPCGFLHWPSVYTRTESFTQWLQSHIQA